MVQSFAHQCRLLVGYSDKATGWLDRVAVYSLLHSHRAEAQ